MLETLCQFNAELAALARYAAFGISNAVERLGIHLFQQHASRTFDMPISKLRTSGISNLGSCRNACADHQEPYKLLAYDRCSTQSRGWRPNLGIESSLCLDFAVASSLPAYAKPSSLCQAF
jgi:hypothetical protein